MSGFDLGWLDLREPVDHAARDASLLAAAGDLLEARDAPLVLDLGSGTGSTVRAFDAAPTTRWRLFDNDPALLGAAEARLGGIEIELCRGDLGDLDALPLDGADLVTASALFDLVSRAWVEGLAERLVRRRVGLYAALNYDGRMEFSVPHGADEAVLAAFNAHQGGDKGFGPALGPASGECLAEIFGAAGYRVRTASSPWKLEPGPLLEAFVDGVADAAAETGRLDPAELEDWRAFRRSDPLGCSVGHLDVLALPPD